MFNYILTPICNINRLYQANKKNIYEYIIFEPSIILIDICNIINSIHITNY